MLLRRVALGGASTWLRAPRAWGGAPRRAARSASSAPRDAPAGTSDTAAAAAADSTGGAAADADREARVYERAFANFLRKRAEAYAALSPPPDERELLAKHREPVVRIWEQLFAMRQLPDLVVCLSASPDVVRECGKMRIPVVSPVDMKHAPDGVTYPIVASAEATGVQADMLRIYREAVRLGNADALRRRRPSRTHRLLAAAGAGQRAELAAARRAWAAAREQDAVQRRVFEVANTQHTPRGGKVAFPDAAKRAAFRARAVRRAVAAEAQSAAQRARAGGFSTAARRGRSGAPRSS